MKTTLRNILLVACVAALSSQAMAGNWGKSKRGWDLGSFVQIVKAKFSKYDDRKKRHHKRKHKKHTAVPELDVAGAGLAMALTGGLIAVARERRKAK